MNYEDLKSELDKVEEKAFKGGYSAGCKSERKRIVETLRDATLRSPLVVRMLLEEVIKVVEDTEDDGDD